MKNYLIIISVVLILFAWLPSQDNAKGSWWNKGVDILKNLSEGNEGKIVKTPSYAEIGEAFKQALRIGTENVVGQLGTIDGFNADPSVHIPLPEELHRIKTMLSKIGMSQLVDDLELKLNRAAQSATPKVKNIFLQAINDMTFDDVKKIYEGPENSATKYFQNRMSLPLKKNATYR